MRISTLDRLILTFGMIWAFPCTFVGLLAGAIGLLSGGHVQRQGHTLEFWGGWVTWQLNHIPLLGAASAMTIGHVILGQDLNCLNDSRLHEWVHVRQYERWGIFFFPAYFGAMVWMVCKGRHPYFDNPFEVEAFRLTEPKADPLSHHHHHDIDQKGRMP